MYHSTTASIADNVQLEKMLVLGMPKKVIRIIEHTMQKRRQTAESFLLQVTQNELIASALTRNRDRDNDNTSRKEEEDQKKVEIMKQIKPQMMRQHQETAYELNNNHKLINDKKIKKKNCDNNNVDDDENSGHDNSSATASSSVNNNNNNNDQTSEKNAKNYGIEDLQRLCPYYRKKKQEADSKANANAKMRTEPTELAEAKHETLLEANFIIYHDGFDDNIGTRSPLPLPLTAKQLNHNEIRKTGEGAEAEAEAEEEGEGEEIHIDDALAVSTQLTRKIFQKFNYTLERLQQSKLYRISTRTTQPAHLISAGVLLFFLMLTGSNFLKNEQQQQPGNEGTPSTVDSGHVNSIAAIIYFGAFAIHFGAQIWMTFVSGLSLYFSLPRHMFGKCQEILFPRYFALNGMLSLLMLYIYSKFFMISWTLTAMLQIGALALSATIELTIRLYLAPPMLELMQEKYRIEDAFGSGKEVGTLVIDDLAHCPHYVRTHKEFRRSHMRIAIGNMMVLMAYIVLLCFMASNVRISS